MQQATEITVLKKRKKKKTWRHCDVCTKSKTIRLICVQSKGLTVDTNTVQPHISGYNKLIFQDITEAAQMFVTK